MNNIDLIHAGKTWKRTKIPERVFTIDEVRSIRARHLKVSATLIAAEYGVARSVIGRIQTRETYKWVDVLSPQESGQ
jgi:hypothetical protein